MREQGIEEAETDAWLLLSFACGIDKNFYYLHMKECVEASCMETYEAFLAERARRVPVQYITGEQEFMGCCFRVNRDVLIPRQDTEILAEEARKRIRPGMDVLDLCTGSGCIIISLLHFMPQVHAVASDISAPALALAKENAARNGVAAEFVESDLFSNIKGSFDMIVSNPPYIPSAEIAGLMPEVRDFEPHLALDGREDGFFLERRIIFEGKNRLKPGGMLLLEIGCGQAEEAVFCMRQAGFLRTLIVKDLAGLDRVAIGEKGGEKCLID